MKKRRSTVYVRPGKDVTLYVPADTPAAVIDYLNHLKEEGTFSQGVIDIVARYVAQQPLATTATAVARTDTDDLAGPFTVTEPPQKPSAVEESPAAWQTSDPPSLEPLETAAAVEPEAFFVARPDETPAPAPPKKFSLTQIFRQAQRNAGKLTNPGENE